MFNLELPPSLRNNPPQQAAVAAAAPVAGAAAAEFAADQVAAEAEVIEIESSTDDDVQEIVVIDSSSSDDNDDEVDDAAAAVAAVAVEDHQVQAVDLLADDDDVDDVVAVDNAAEDNNPIDWNNVLIAADQAAVQAPPADVPPPADQQAVGLLGVLRAGAGAVRRLSARSPQQGQRSNSAVHRQNNQRQRTPQTPLQRLRAGISNVIRGRTPPSNPPPPSPPFPDPFEPPPPPAVDPLPGLWSDPSLWSSTSVFWNDARQPLNQHDLAVQTVASLQPDNLRTTFTNHPAYNSLQLIVDGLNVNEPPNNQRHLLSFDGWANAEHVATGFCLSFRPNSRYVEGQRHLNGTLNGDIVEKSLDHIVDTAVQVMNGAFPDLVQSPEVARSLLLATSVFTNRMFIGESNILLILFHLSVIMN